MSFQQCHPSKKYYGVERIYMLLAPKREHAVSESMIIRPACRIGGGRKTEAGGRMPEDEAKAIVQAILLPDGREGFLETEDLSMAW